MNIFETSTITLGEAIFIGGMFASLVIILGMKLSGWFTSHELKKAHARLYLLESEMTELQLELFHLRKQTGDQEWDRVQKAIAHHAPSAGKTTLRSVDEW